MDESKKEKIFQKYNIESVYSKTAMLFILY